MKTAIRKILSLALICVLAVGLIPATVFADEDDGGMQTLSYESIKYIDKDKVEQTALDAELITDTTTDLVGDGPSGGWYYVTGEVETTDLTVTGAVHLILSDGCTLTANGSTANNGTPGISVTDSNSLTIYGQSGGNGKLVARGKGDEVGSAGIGGSSDNINCGSVTINGGNVMVNGGTGGGAGLGGGSSAGGVGGSGGTITINSGAVHANGGHSAGGGGAGIGGGMGIDGGDGGTISINGGTVNATGGNSSNNMDGGGAGIGGGGAGGGAGGGGGNITISGGTVTATGGTVTATGGSSNAATGAGLGGGGSLSGSGSGGNILIYGSNTNVTAQSVKDNSPDIGGTGDNTFVALPAGNLTLSNPAAANTVKFTAKPEAEGPITVNLPAPFNRTIDLGVVPTLAGIDINMLTTYTTESIIFGLTEYSSITKTGTELMTSGMTVDFEGPTYTASLLLNKDGVPYLDHNKNISLRLEGYEKYVYPMTSESAGGYLNVRVFNGTWKVYDGDTFTGSTIVIRDTVGSGTVDYYTVDYSVVDGGKANGSTIAASSGGKAVASGDVLLGGASITFIAKGSGATTYTYAWGGTNNTSSTYTTTVNDTLNAVCTVTGSVAQVEDPHIPPSPAPANTTYTINASAGEGGTITPSGSVSVRSGGDQAFIITPDSNHHIKDVLVNGISVGITTNYIFDKVSRNHSIQVVFAANETPPTVKPTTPPSGGGGSSSGSGSSSSTPSPKTKLPASSFHWDDEHTLTIKHINISVKGLSKVLWDGVETTAYKVTEGSVIIQFDEDFIEKQLAGEHLIRVEFKNHYGEYTITLDEDSSSDKDLPDGNLSDGDSLDDNADTTPETKEPAIPVDGKSTEGESMWWLWLIILAALLAAAAVLVAWRGKKQNDNE